MAPFLHKETDPEKSSDLPRVSIVPLRFSKLVHLLPSLAEIERQDNRMLIPSIVALLVRVVSGPISPG